MFANGSHCKEPVHRKSIIGSKRYIFILFATCNWFQSGESKKYNRQAPVRWATPNGMFYASFFMKEIYNVKLLVFLGMKHTIQKCFIPGLIYR